MEKKCQNCDFVLPSGECVLGRDSKKCVSPDVRQGVFFSKKAFVMILTRNVFLAITGITALIALLAGGIWLTCRPAFCGSCHEMKADYVAWKSSTHQNTSCIQCHVKPGLTNLLIDKVKSIKSLFYHFTGGYDKPLNKDSKLASEISNESCLLCHTEGRDESLGHGLLFKHQAHLKYRMLCTECHNRVAHPIKGYTNFLKMESCKRRCHDGKALNNNCDFCHSQSFLLKAKKKVKKSSSNN